MQAARRASLTPDDQGSSDIGTTPLSRRTRPWLFLGVALGAYAVDQVTKHLAVEHLAGKPARPLLGDLLQLTFTRNPGAAFSTGTGITPVFAVLALVAAVVVVWFGRRAGSALWAVGLGLLLAGVVGNLTDRLLREPGPLRGHVVDFLMLPHWPIFNVADICINVAAVVIVVQAVRGVRLGGDREPTRDDAHG